MVLATVHNWIRVGLREARSRCGNMRYALSVGVLLNVRLHASGKNLTDVYPDGCTRARWHTLWMLIRVVRRQLSRRIAHSDVFLLSLLPKWLFLFRCVQKIPAGLYSLNLAVRMLLEMAVCTPSGAVSWL